MCHHPVYSMHIDYPVPSGTETHAQFSCIFDEISLNNIQVAAVNFLKTLSHFVHFILNYKVKMEPCKLNR